MMVSAQRNPKFGFQKSVAIPLSQLTSEWFSRIFKTVFPLLFLLALPGLSTAAPYDDTDGDGVLNGTAYVPVHVSSITIFVPITDNCISVSNPHQEDDDDDGTGDHCDADGDIDNDGYINSIDPDDDGDEMPDTWEDTITGLSKTDPDDAHYDEDNDGYTNLVEYLADTNPTDAANSTGDVVGITQGGFSVDSTGGANYSIPIIIPPGTAGMAPSLSLSYNSNSENSIVGMGWTLGGLSVISRCPATIAQDGEVNGLDYDNEDRFCIDGQRLIAISGTYGEAYTEYRTEVDGFTKIVSYGSTGSGSDWGPEFFRAWTKTGQILEYGNTSDSRIEAWYRNSARLWAVNKISDTVGNYLTVTYAENNGNGEYRPTQIDYTGNTGQSLSTSASVVFDYESRTDVFPKYIAGSKISLTQRMTSIGTYVGATKVREYKLGYDNNGPAGATRLINLEECDGGTGYGQNAQICLPKTFFDFISTGSGYSGIYSYNPAENEDFSNSSLHMNDVNGDGLQDLVTLQVDAGTLHSYVSLNNGNGTFAGIVSDAIGPSANFPQWEIVDVNADGMDDFVAMKLSSDEPSDYTDFDIFVALSNGDGTFDDYQGSEATTYYPYVPTNAKRQLADVNGDGFVDAILHIFYSNNWHPQVLMGNGDGTFNDNMYAGSPHYVGANLSSWSAMVGDVNGDGKADAILQIADSSGWHSKVLFSLGDATFGNLESTTHYGGYHSDWSVTTADMNGDGKSDLVMHLAHSSAWDALVATSNGNVFNSVVHTPLSYDGFDTSWQTIFTDMNGDGMADAVTQNAASDGWITYIGLSKGDGTFEEAQDVLVDGFDFSYPGDRLHLTPDIDGDGINDLFMVVAGPWGIYMDTAFSQTKVSLLEEIREIRDSQVKTTTITYNTLTDTAADIYTKGSGATYPDLDIQAPIYVVSNVSTDNGIGGQRDFDYSYSGARVNLTGRGLLGFHTMTAVDYEAGIKSITTYKQAFPYIGMVASTEQKRVDNGTTLGSITTDWANIETYTDLTYFPYPSEVIKLDRELNNTDVVKTTTTSTYDSYGSPSTILVKMEDMVNTSDVFYTHTSNTYHTTGGWITNWLLGRLTRTEVTQYLPGNSDTKNGTCTTSSCAKRVSSFAYNSTTGLITQEVVEPDTASLKLQTDYTHDGFGNRLTATVTGGSGGTAITSRTTTTAYDSRGQFPTSLTNALSHVETRTWDAKFGVMLTLSGPNKIAGGSAQMTTSWTYDTFGRKITEDREDGTFSDIFTSWCPGSTFCPTGAAIKQVTLSTGAAPQVVFMDILGREIKTITLGLNGKLVHTSTEYNADGQVESKSLPYFTTDTVRWHDFTYDLAGRPTQETKPFSSSQTVVTTMAYSGLSTTITNGLSQVTTRKNNARGELVEVIDDLSTSTKYTYDPFANLLTVKVNNNPDTTITNTYNIRGNKLTMLDPDMDSWSYGYNALGELISQTDANAKVTTMSYDTLGRLTQRVDDSTGGTPKTSSWTYDYPTGQNYAYGQANRMIGKLVKSVGGEGETKVLTYDAEGRPWEETTTIDTVDYKIVRTYDSYSRLATLTYPVRTHLGTGLVVYHSYDVYGHLKKVCRYTSCESGNGLYWRADTANAAGQLTGVTSGNGVVNQQSYNAYTGMIDGIYTRTPLAGTSIFDVQDLTFEFDKLGNLVRRVDQDQDIKEDFEYDDLNRLRYAHFYKTVSGSYALQSTKETTYDIYGNLTSKTDIGSYAYGDGSAGIHAVTSITNGGTTRTLTYDANGNQTGGWNFTDGASRSQTWTTYNMVKTITQGGTTLTFSYDAERNRFKQVNGSKTTLYVGGLFEKETTSTSTTYVHYIAGGSVVYKSIDATTDSEQTRYVHRDHLGSVTAITNESGYVAEDLSYDAWGKRRNSNWSSDAFTLLNITTRGYTGHEMLDDVDIIHMNGRVYDPNIGRFLSADPTMQFPDNPQNLNRYSYVMNNPLSFTDPSGFGIVSFIQKLVNGFWNTLGKVMKVPIIRTAVAIGVMFIPGVNAAALGYLSGMIASGGDLKTGIISALTAGMFYGVGELGSTFASLGEAGAHMAKSIAHGLVGGISSELQGGDFLSGFASAGFAQFVGGSRFMQTMDKTGQAISRIIVGGVSAELGGGKFKNGAVTAAMAYAFNDLAHKAELEAKLKLLANDDRFKTADLAAKDVLNATAPLSAKYGLEIGGNILRDSRGYYYSEPIVGTIDTVIINGANIGYHTHVNGNIKFSNNSTMDSPGDGNDALWVQTNKKSLYLGTTSNGQTTIRVCNPGNCSVSLWGGALGEAVP